MKFNKSQKFVLILYAIGAILGIFYLGLVLSHAQEQEIPPAPDVREPTLQFFFKGAWLPDLDPAEIGPDNYSKLKNLRYGPEAIGLEGVQGYTKINTTALTTYTKARSGFQLNTDRTTASYVIVQAENAGETASRLFVNTTAVPDQGDFSASVELDTSGNEYRDDTAGAGLGRFSEAPNGVTYCNGVECLVWSGEEMRVGSFITMANADPYNAGAYPIVNAEAVNNQLATAGNTVAVGSGSRDYFLVMTTRPIQGVYFDMSVVNTTAAVLDIHYRKSDGSGWAAITETDGTLVGGTDTLGQDGWVTWDHITDVAPYHYEGFYLYAYRFGVNSAEATIQYITVNAPMQTVLDLWDGVPRQPIQFKVWRNGDSKFKDFTLEVNEGSFESVPLVAQLDAMTTSDYMIIMADDRLSGFQFSFIAGWVNTAASRGIVVEYWNGSAYTAVPGSEVDGTLLSTASFGQNGMVWWTPPAETAEAVKTEFGVTGYSYKVYFTTGTLSGTYTDESDIMTEAGDIALDVVTLLPAQKTIPPFKFSSQYRNRVINCGYIQGKEGNRCDYTGPNSTEQWNGADSSDGGVQSLYFGGSEALTAGGQIYNRYGSQVIMMWVALKDTELYVLKGDSPEDFTIDQVSENIGCPAPLTMASVEVAFDLAQNVRRNIQIWLSSVGPYSFDGQVLAPIKGIDKYFDADNADCINFDEIGRSVGWYDATKKEYNLLIPSGSSQTTNNVWLVYDVIKKKWFRKDTGDASFPQVGFPVQDIYGSSYVYGAIDSGYMMRLENGASWDGSPIEQVVETGDFWPTNNVWDLTRIRQIKVMAKRIPEAHQLTIQHSADTDDSLGLSGVWQNWDGGEWQDWDGGEWVSASLASIELSLSDSINRVARDTVKDNLFGWTHRLEFSVSTDETTKGLQPIGWGIVYQKVGRRDE